MTIAKIRGRYLPLIKIAIIQTHIILLHWEFDKLSLHTID